MLDHRTINAPPAAARTSPPSEPRRRSNPVGSAAIVAALLIARLASPTTSSAAWTAPVNVSDTGGDAYFSQVAVAADGDAVIVWQFDDGSNELIQAATVSETGVLGVPQTLSVNFGLHENPKVAIDADGNALVVWQHRSGNEVLIKARTVSEIGVLGMPQTLSDPAEEAKFPEVAVDADGDALITWEYGSGVNQRIQVVRRTAAGVLDLVQTLTVAGNPAYGPKVAMAADGHAALTWLGDDGTAMKVRAVTVSPTGTFGVIQTLSTADVDAESAHVGVDANGNAVISWLRFNGNYFRVHARTMSAAGVLGMPHTLSDGGQDAFLPKVAVGPNGVGVISWQRDSRIQAVTLSTADALGVVKTLSVTDGLVGDSDVAVDANGNAIITWERFDGSDFRIHARTLSATGVLGMQRTLSDAGQSASGAHVGVDANGDAVVVWSRSDGIDDRIQSVLGP